MTIYFVHWEIEVSASSPQEAANLALAIQRNPKSTSITFSVVDDQTDSEWELEAAGSTLFDAQVQEIKGEGR